MTSTDDFLCSFSSDAILARFAEHMKKFVPITIESKPVMKYLNCRIVQTDLGVSFDQTNHIRKTILPIWFPKDRTEKVKTADTPYRTDSEYERAMRDALPATPTELAALEKEFGGKYNAMIGQLLHVWVVSRFELGFALG